MILTGDLNSTPSSSLYDFVVRGSWKPSEVGDSNYARHDVKLLLDKGMRKIARWLRGIGVDAACWDDEEEEALSAVHATAPKETPTIDGAISICSCVGVCNRTCKGLSNSKARAIQAMFAKAIREGRTLITCSTKVVERRNCPPYLLVRSSGKDAFKDIVDNFNLRFKSDQVYTRCTVCNGGLQVRINARCACSSAHHTLTYNLYQQDSSLEEIRKNPPASFPESTFSNGEYVDEDGNALQFYRCKRPSCGQVRDNTDKYTHLHIQQTNWMDDIPETTTSPKKEKKPTWTD